MTEKQAEIIEKLGVESDIDLSEEIRQRTEFLKNYLGATGLDGFVLGVSGGQDSLLAGLLAKQAVEERRQEGFEAEFHAARLPCGEQADEDDAQLACDVIAPDVTHEINIKHSTNALANEFEAQISDFDKGNIKARMRMIAQYAIARENDLAVIGTDHAAEAVTGFFTKYGDGGADILPLSGLTKRQGKELVCELGAPEQLVAKQPTADLLDERPAQPDETELGLTYDTIDNYLEGQKIDSSAAAEIERRYRQTRHKRELPVTMRDDWWQQ